MKVLICGANGQVGRELQCIAPPEHEIIAMGSSTLNITQRNSVIELIASCKPDIVINAAAYTAVDKAEQEIELAYAVNADGAGYLAEICGANGIKLVHLSTDFVFDGEQSSPYKPEDETNPLNVYGGSKLEGERLVQNLSGDNALIIRTAWVYSRHGSNFVKTMLKLMDEREQLGVISDQIGTPTNAESLARFIWIAVCRGLSGIYHWTDAGVASWYDFAVAIAEEGQVAGLLKPKVRINPIATADFKTLARRPKFSVLDKKLSWSQSGIKPLHWRVSLRNLIQEI